MIDVSDANMKKTLRIEEILMKANLVFSGIETSTDVDKLHKLNDILQKVGNFYIHLLLSHFLLNKVNRKEIPGILLRSGLLYIAA